jgi:hypothetical protein
MWRAPDSAQWLSSGVPDCPVRPSPAASPTAMEVVGGYKYHLIRIHPSILNISLIARAKDFTPRHNQSNQSTQSPKINSSALGLVRGSLVFFVALVAWLGLFFSLLFLK